MTDPRLDVLCIGNAIVDVIADATDEFLIAEGLTKDSMRLVDAEVRLGQVAHDGLDAVAVGPRRDQPVPASDVRSPG